MSGMSWLTILNNEVVACTRCPRGSSPTASKVAREKRRAYRDSEYWGKPVPGFGDPDARVLIMVLAPGAHGSNCTGRPFIGDASGNFMYPIILIWHAVPCSPVREIRTLGSVGAGGG
jgi:uracil-DNA glycosylase